MLSMQIAMYFQCLMGQYLSNTKFYLYTESSNVLRMDINWIYLNGTVNNTGIKNNKKNKFFVLSCVLETCCCIICFSAYLGGMTFSSIQCWNCRKRYKNIILYEHKFQNFTYGPVELSWVPFSRSLFEASNNIAWSACISPFAGS